jgi:hypothetical protein
MMIAPHAILRYLERVEGFDIEAARQRLRPATVRVFSDSALVVLLEQEEPALIERVKETLMRDCADAANAGARSLVSGGVKYAFRDHALVTVMRAGSRVKRRKRERKTA